LAEQFDITRNLNAAAREIYPFLLIMQHDHLRSLQSVVVAPLVLAGGGIGHSRLHPLVDVLGQSYLVKIEDIAAVPRGAIGPVVGSARGRRYAIVAGLDLLFTGV